MSGDTEHDGGDDDDVIPYAYGLPELRQKPTAVGMEVLLIRESG